MSIDCLRHYSPLAVSLSAGQLSAKPQAAKNVIETGPYATTTPLENSDVLPSGSVAVAVITWPADSGVVKVSENVPLPLEFVVTVANPRKVIPTLCVLGPELRLVAKSSIRNVAPGLFGLLSVPERIVLFAVTIGVFSTG